MAITELVFKTHDNENVVSVVSSISATPLAGVTRITAELSGGAVVDSDIDAAAITWTDTAITFAFGDVVASGLNTADIVAYSPTYPDGQVVAHKNGLSEARVSFRFIE